MEDAHLHVLIVVSARTSSTQLMMHEFGLIRVTRKESMDCLSREEEEEKLASV